MRTPGSGGSGRIVSPAAEFADLVSTWIHAGLRRGARLPKYSNAMGMLGESQIDVRPNAPREASVQVKAKCSPRRSFDQITACRCASTRSSKETWSFVS